MVLEVSLLRFELCEISFDALDDVVLDRDGVVVLWFPSGSQ